jgi:hypothetical protein
MDLALLVSVILLFVYWAVDFHDETSSDAVEIDDEPSDGVLPAELEPAQPAGSKLLPKAVFRRSRPPPHSNCLLTQVGPHRAECNFT